MFFYSNILNDNWFSFSPIFLTIIGLVFQYYVSRPNVIIENIEASHQNPFYHKFTIKNVGMTKGYSLAINLINPYFVTTDNITIMPGPGEKPTFNDLTKISNIDLSPQQFYQFKPSEFIKFVNIGPGIKKGSIKIRFRYKDLWRIFSYEEEYNLMTEIENDHLKWIIIGDQYYEDFKKNKW